jgi:hypothetical protein
MFMQKIEAPRVTCDLFAVTKGFDGNGGSAVDRGSKPRTANEAEALAYADFIRRKNDLPELCKPVLARGSYPGGGRRGGGDLLYVGATFGAMMQGPTRDAATGAYIPAQYEVGAFSVLFPGANMTRQAVTFETLDDAGEVLTSSTMPVEPKKGGIVWGKDEVRKACGPVAKPAKAARPTVAKRRAAPTVDKRRAAIMLALKLRRDLRRARDIAADRLRHIIDLTSDLHGVGAESGQDCAAPVTPTHAAPVLPDAILSDLAAAERLMSGADYVAPKPRKVRAPGHERAILRAWAMRKARRTAEAHLRIGAAQYEQLKAERDAASAERNSFAVDLVQAKGNLRAMYDKARLAEQEAAEAKAMRDDMRGMLAALERRAEMAEAENAELWAEIEALTAPITAAQGAIPVQHGAA